MARETRVDDRKVLTALRDLAKNRVPRAISNTLNNVSFDIRKAEGAMVARALTFSGPSTKKFLGNERSFLVGKAKPGELRATVFAKDKANQVLALHETGGKVVTRDKRTLNVGRRIAIPVHVRKSARGRVAKSKTPAALLRNPAKRTFIAGDAVLQRTGKGARTKTKVLFALDESFRTSPQLTFHKTAERVARKQFPKRAREAIKRHPLHKN